MNTGNIDSNNEDDEIIDGIFDFPNVPDEADDLALAGDTGMDIEAPIVDTFSDEEVAEAVEANTDINIITNVDLEPEDDNELPEIDLNQPIPLERRLDFDRIWSTEYDAMSYPEVVERLNATARYVLLNTYSFFSLMFGRKGLIKDVDHIFFEIGENLGGRRRFLQEEVVTEFTLTPRQAEVFRQIHDTIQALSRRLRERGITGLLNPD